MTWSRSDIVATAAFLVSLGGLLFQYHERQTPFDVQSYVDRTQAAGKIIDALEQLIQARQLAMIDVDYNIYEPQRLSRMSLEQMNSDAKQATPVVVALGNWESTLQNNVRFFNKPETIRALHDLEAQAMPAVRCFTDLASARHKFGAEQLALQQQTIARSCDGANVPNSLDNLKQAEAVAIDAMDAEGAAVTGAPPSRI